MGVEDGDKGGAGYVCDGDLWTSASVTLPSSTLLWNPANRHWPVIGTFALQRLVREETAGLQWEICKDGTLGRTKSRPHKRGSVEGRPPSIH